MNSERTFNFQASPRSMNKSAATDDGEKLRHSGDETARPGYMNCEQFN